MATDDQKLRLLSEERTSLRPAILAMQVSMHHALFALVTLTGVIVGLYWKEDVVPQDARPIVMFVATQAQFFLFLFVIGLVAHQNVATGYIAALETTINTLAGDTLNVFESHISPHFYQRPLSPFGFAKILIFLFLLSLFILVGRAAILDRRVTFILIGEGVALALLLLATVTGEKHVRDYALEKLTVTSAERHAA